MQQAQRVYAMNRVDEIARRKTRELQQSQRGTNYAEDILSGAIKVRRDLTEVNQYSSIRDVFDFSKVNKREKKDAEVVAGLIRQIEDRANEIRDQIMLGDEEVALSLLNAFDKD